MLSKPCISSDSIPSRAPLKQLPVSLLCKQPAFSVCNVSQRHAACLTACPTPSRNTLFAQATALIPLAHVVDKPPSWIYVQTRLIWTYICHVLPTAAPCAASHLQLLPGRRDIPIYPPVIHLRVHSAGRSPFQTVPPRCLRVWQLLRPYHVHLALLHCARGMVRMREDSEVVCAPFRTPRANIARCGICSQILEGAFALADCQLMATWDTVHIVTSMNQLDCACASSAFGPDFVGDRQVGVLLC